MVQFTNTAVSLTILPREMCIIFWENYDRDKKSTSIILLAAIDDLHETAEKSSGAVKYIHH